MFQYARLLHAEIKKTGCKNAVLPHLGQAGTFPKCRTGLVQPPRRTLRSSDVRDERASAKKTDFETWRKQHQTGLAGGLNGAYFDIAKELHAKVAPVGVAWKKALAADKNLVLHQDDKSHPNPAGSYLAACVFYATLLGKSPAGLPAEIKKDGKVLLQVPAGPVKTPASDCMGNGAGSTVHYQVPPPSG